MAIKRSITREHIEEIDDSQDTITGTSMPSSLIGKENTKKTITSPEPTGTPEQQTGYQQPYDLTQGQHVSGTNETIGRTPSDLASLFIKHPGFVPTILVFLPFMLWLFRGQLKQVVDFGQPLLLGIILIAVWYGAGIIPKK